MHFIRFIREIHHFYHINAGVCPYIALESDLGLFVRYI